MRICKSNICKTDTRLVMFFIHKKKQYSLLIVFIMVVISDVVVGIVLIVDVVSAKKNNILSLLTLQGICSPHRILSVQSRSTLSLLFAVKSTIDPNIFYSL